MTSQTSDELPAGSSQHGLADKPKQPPLSVGVVGLGHMGTAFALNLIEDGHRVVVYDRDRSRVELLQKSGAKGVAGMDGLAVCDIVITSLPNDDAVENVALGSNGLIQVLREGSVHVSTSTISPALSRNLASKHKARGQGYAAAPVLGNPDLARSRKLFVLVAGDSKSLTKIRKLLERLGQRLFIMGEDAAVANLMKLAGNALTAMTLQSLGEVLALLRKSGLDGHLAFDVLTNSLFDSKVHRTYGGKIIDSRYLPAGMAVPLAVKDLRLALAEAEREAVPMPATSQVHDRLVEMMARGWSELDWSALGLLAASNAGLDAAIAAAPK